MARDSPALPRSDAGTWAASREQGTGEEEEKEQEERESQLIRLEDELVRSIAEMGPELDCMAVELGGFAALSTFEGAVLSNPDVGGAGGGAGGADTATNEKDAGKSGTFRALPFQSPSANFSDTVFKSAMDEFLNCQL